MLLAASTAPATAAPPSAVAWAATLRRPWPAQSAGPGESRGLAAVVGYLQHKLRTVRVQAHAHQRGAVRMLEDVVQRFLLDKVQVAAQSRRQAAGRQRSRHLKHHAQPGHRQHVVGVGASAVKQLGQCVVVVVEAPNHVVELAYGGAAGFGNLVQLPTLTRWVGQAFLQQVALQRNLAQQRAHVVVQVGGQSAAQAGLATALVAAVLPAPTGCQPENHQGQPRQARGRALFPQAGNFLSLSKKPDWVRAWACSQLTCRAAVRARVASPVRWSRWSL